MFGSRLEMRSENGMHEDDDFALLQMLPNRLENRVAGIEAVVGCVDRYAGCAQVVKGIVDFRTGIYSAHASHLR